MLVYSVSLIRETSVAGLLILALLPAHSASAAATKDVAGKEIFRQKCAKCHGRNGEGVKGKYDDPLRGDRSVEKLTRYIERNMPDDKPGTVVGEKATAVANYIYS